MTQKKVRQQKLSPKKRIFFFLILLLFFLGTIELISFMVWRKTLDVSKKNNIKVLCGQHSEEPEKLPNTFWHHEFNPNHNKYTGLINAKGTKGEDFLIPKPDKELRIICLGDSTVEGTGVEPDQSFPSFLEEMLAADINKYSDYKSVRVINAGIGSHNSAFNLAYLAFRLIHFEPDILVIKSTYNDYLPYLVPGLSNDYTNAFPRPFHKYQTKNPYWFFARSSYFLKILGSLIFKEEIFNPFEDFSGHITLDQYQQMDYSRNKEKFYIYAENIRSMILLCKGRDMKVIVLDLPTSPDPDHYGKNQKFGALYRNLILRFEMELERVTDEEDVTFITTELLDENDFIDHCHNSSTGNKKIALKIYNVLLEKKRLFFSEHF